MTSPTLTHLHDPLADLRRLGLAAGSLYLSGGVPQVFCRVYPAPEDDAVNRCLYIPSARLEDLPSLLGADRALPPNATFAGEPVTIDDTSMHPLVIDGAVRGFVGPPQAGKSCPPAILTAVLERVILHYARLDQCGNPMVEEFLGRLFHRDSSPDRFLAGILNFLTEQIPGGLAVTYNETDGIFRLRLAVGDIASWDKLDGALTHATVDGWTAAIECGRPYVPVGFLPDYPIFLDDPPTFVFVHDAISARHSRSIIAMPVPGDLTPVQARHLEEIGRIIARLHISQFGLTDDLLSMWTMYRRVADGARTLDDVLLEAFSLLDRRVEISRLVYIDPVERSRTVLRRTHSDPAIRHDDDTPVAAGVLDAATSGSHLMPNPTDGEPLTEEEAKQYYLSNVKSEFCLSVRTRRGRRARLAVGSSSEGDHLAPFERFFETVAIFIDLCREAAEADDVSASPGDSGRDAERASRAAERLNTMRKLTDGYFHGIIDRLSYLLGEAELIENQAPTTEIHSAADNDPSRFIQSIEAVVAAMERVRILLGGDTDDMRRPVRATHLLAELPATFEGVAHRLQDSKNIAIRVVPARSIRTNLHLTAEEMYDYVYPVILALMDEAICSGKIIVRATTRNDIDALAIECDPEIIGHTTLGAVIVAWAGQPAESGDLAASGSLPVGNFTWTWDCLTGTRHRAWLVRTRTAEASTNPPKDSARVRDRGI